MPQFIQVDKNGKKRLQRWDRLSYEQREVVEEMLSGKNLNSAQKAVLSDIGEVRRLYVTDDDGELVVEDVKSGLTYKRGVHHDKAVRGKLKRGDKDAVSGKPGVPNVGGNGRP